MIKIEKTIYLDFLGEEYADSFVRMKAIPMKDYPKMQDKIESVQSKNDNKEAMGFMVSIVQDNFVSGSIKQGEEKVELTADALEDMPGEFFFGIIERLVGQAPKA